MEELEARGFDRRDDQPRGSRGDLPEGRGAGLLDFGVRGKIFKWQHIVRRQADDACRVQRAGKLARGEHGLVQRLGGLVVGDEDERWRGRNGLYEEREIEGAGGEGEARDASTALTGLKMPADTIVRVGVFEVGEKLADEGKNHAGLVYRSGWPGREIVTTMPGSLHVSVDAAESRCGRDGFRRKDWNCGSREERKL